MDNDLDTLPRLIIAASENDADLLYATRFFVPDACVLVDEGGRRTLLLSSLEVDRGRREAQVDEVLSTEPLRQELKEAHGGKEPKMLEVITQFLSRRDARRYRVPASFPLGLAQALQAEGLKLEPVEGLFYKEREFKTSEELRLMRAANEVSERGLRRGFEVLGEATIANGTGELHWQGAPLTSEILRAEIDSEVLRAGGSPANTIVAGGEQACDPHERGSGALRAEELIILDVFPRHSSGFFGDLTRTVIKGRAGDAQKQLWDLVLEGQQRALQAIRPAVEGQEVQEDIRRFFADNGYPTREAHGRWTGFFHGLGHGLGLEIHEEPRISHTTFQPGQVFTVEPGLYYPGVGGVRHEDVVVVTENGCDILSSIEKPMIID